MAICLLLCNPKGQENGNLKSSRPLRKLICYIVSRRAVVSREAKKKQQASTYSGQYNHYSELLTQMVDLNF